MKTGKIFGGSAHCYLNAAGSGVTEHGGTLGVCCTLGGGTVTTFRGDITGVGGVFGGLSAA
eukprot:1073587-Ditylum_brightwellii.AAC.1